MHCHWALTVCNAMATRPGMSSRSDTREPGLRNPMNGNEYAHRVNQLYLACQKGQVQIVNSLLERGYGEYMDTPAENGYTSLMIACYHGHTAIVSLFLDKGANIDIQGYQGWTALMIASQGGHSNIVKLLIEKGAQVNKQNDNGGSALMIASEHGHKDTVKLLIEKGAQVNMQKNDGWSALMAASKNGHKDTAKLLIERGALVNMQKNDGGSALHIACFNGKKEVAQALIIDHHCDVTLLLNNAHTALDIALDQGLADIVTLLLSMESTSTEAQSSTFTTLSGDEESSATIESYRERHCDISPATMDSSREKSPTLITPLSHNETGTSSPVAGRKDSKTAPTQPASEGDSEPIQREHTTKVTETQSSVKCVGALTIEDLKLKTGLSDQQLDTKVEEQDFHDLAGLFDQVESYLWNLGLTEAQQTDIKDIAFRRGTHTAMTEALKLWRRPNPLLASFRALLKVLLHMRRGDVALKVCQYLQTVYCQ